MLLGGQLAPSTSAKPPSKTSNSPAAKARANHAGKRVECVNLAPSIGSGLSPSEGTEKLKPLESFSQLA
jgi:hypothetical protein